MGTRVIMGTGRNTLSLKSLERKIRICKKCDLFLGRINTVPGEGPANARVMFVGLAPGTKEDKVGKPFVGMAGRFLNVLFRKNNIDRKKVFITSVIKCFLKPGKTPTKKQVAACKPYLAEQIKIVNPEVVVLLGNVAEKSLEGEEILKNKKVVKTYHPAAGMRFPKIKKKMLNDFREIGRLIKKL